VRGKGGGREREGEGERERQEAHPQHRRSRGEEGEGIDRGGGQIAFHSGLVCLPAHSTQGPGATCPRHDGTWHATTVSMRYAECGREPARGMHEKAF